MIKYARRFLADLCKPRLAATSKRLTVDVALLVITLYIRAH